MIDLSLSSKYLRQYFPYRRLGTRASSTDNRRGVAGVAAFKIAIRFSREVDSAMGGIESAIRDVRRILPELRLIESGPDLVGLSEITEHLGSTRQNVRKLMINNYMEFPQLFHDGKTQIWRLAEALAWLKLHT